MNPPVQFNPFSLLAVKPRLDNLLGQVSRDLEIYFAAPETNRETLQSALVGFHGIYDLLQTLSLDGVTAFCAEVEIVLQEFIAGVLSPSPVYRSTFQNALLALTHHLDALAGGINKPALCLFPQYQELQQARGMEMAFEVDLFFPDLQVELPPSVLIQPPGEAPQAHIKAERGKYQTALLKWMRQDNPIEALQSMRGAVRAFMECVPQNQQRTFWWVASALLDCMIYQGLSSGQDAKKLLSRIDLQMKSLADGQLVDPQDSLREMLYLIACNDGVSNTVSEVKRVYALESYLPPPTIETGPVLESIVAPEPKLLGGQLKIEPVRGGLDIAADMTTSHLHKPQQVIGYSHPTLLSKNDIQVAGYVGPQSTSASSGRTDHYSLADSIAHGSEQPQPAVSAAALSPSQLAIATEEAAQHVASLMWHLAELRESVHPSVSDDFLHEAYTLAVVSRTMGFTRIAELAYALEQWLEAHLGHPLALSNAQLSLLERTVAVLDDMDTAARNRQELQAQPELIARLQADRELIGPAKASQRTPETSLPETHGLESPATQQRVVQDDVDEHLLPVFLEEANDIWPHVAGNMRAWRERPEDKALGRSLHRILHTLKGSARMAGAMHVGDLTHRMEECVVQAMSQAQPDRAVHDELDGYFDRIGNALEQLRVEKSLADQADAVAAASPEAALPDADTKRAMLRVRFDTVDRLMNGAGEISASRSHVETELRNFKNGLAELVESVSRLRGQLREVEIQTESQIQAHISLSENMAEKFDPLEFDRFTRLQELTRFMNESVHDVLTVQQTLLKNLDEASAAISTQTYLNRELQQNLMEIRMTPFASISERLYRIVRQTSKELNKKARLELHGTEVELDRSVLGRMTAPFEHMLRNALAHGLESPPQRERMGKPPIGVISLSLRQEGNEVIFEFSDDGAGINLARLRQKAVELGIPQPDENASDEQVIQLIFTPGLTTATEVTEVSGRGVGMDVVRSEITALGGRIEVSSTWGKGTHFVSRLPLTLAATQALLVRSGQAVHAIPSGMVEQVQQVKPAVLKAIYRQGYVEWKSRQYPLHYLPRLLGNAECVPESHPYNRVLLLHSGEQRLAIHVEDLIGTQEIVFKNMGPQLAHLSGIAGAAVLGNGNVALVLNPVQLVQRFMSARKTTMATAVEPTPAPPLVMVVDDSLTARKTTGRLLARAGYHVVTAKDGVDALEQLGEISPSVMLLDIEMPRMDGFELTTHLRRDPKTRHLPIIMITSRTAEKHRNYALELGVNVYLGKPYQEDELLRHIAAIVTTSMGEPSGVAPHLMNPQIPSIS